MLGAQLGNERAPLFASMRASISGSNLPAYALLMASFKRVLWVGSIIMFRTCYDLFRTCEPDKGAKPAKLAKDDDA